MAKPITLKSRVSRAGGKEALSEGSRVSRLVRYPTASNALRALLNDGGVRAVSIEPRPRAGQFPILGSKPSPSDRSKPSPQAVRLIRDAVGAESGSRAGADGGTARPLPRIEPSTILQGIDLGEMVRIRRQMLKLSQKQLAEQAGIGRRFVGELEAGKPTVELGKTLAACAALGLTLTLQVSDGG